VAINASVVLCRGRGRDEDLPPQGSLDPHEAPTARRLARSREEPACPRIPHVAVGVHYGERLTLGLFPERVPPCRVLLSSPAPFRNAFRSRPRCRLRCFLRGIPRCRPACRPISHLLIRPAQRIPDAEVEEDGAGDNGNPDSTHGEADAPLLQIAHDPRTASSPKSASPREETACTFSTRWPAARQWVPEAGAASPHVEPADGPLFAQDDRDPVAASKSLACPIRIPGMFIAHSRIARGG
jgi:hypothetical protein